MAELYLSLKTNLMGERGPSPWEEKMSRRDFLKKTAKLTAVGAGLAMGLGGDRPQNPAEVKKEFPPEPEISPKSPETKHQELLQRLFAEIPESNDPKIKNLTQLEKNKLKADFNKRLEAAAPFLPHTMKIFRAEGVPAQLALLSLPESGFETSATSRRKTHGPFQFTSATAEAYGLTVSEKIDERRDPFLASRAAARLLKDLYQRKGSWEEAILAYNSGMALRFKGELPEYLEHVEREQFSKHKITKRSAKESLHYLPRFFATRQLFQEYLVRADKLAAPVSATQFKVSLPETRPRLTYFVKSGEKLFRIARQLGIKSDELRRWNQIDDPRHLQAGQKLHYFPGEPATPRPSELARQTGLTLEQLGDANPSWADRLLEENDRLPPDFSLTLPDTNLASSDTRLRQLTDQGEKSNYRFSSPDFWVNLKDILETDSPT